MNLDCPQCGSKELKKLSLIYADGFSYLDARSRGGGLMLGSGGGNPGVGTFSTKGQIQSRLSQKVSPPCKWSYWKVIFIGLVGLLVLEFILGYVYTFLRIGGDFNQQLAFFGYAWLGLIAFTLCLAIRHNFAVYPYRYHVWNRSFMCRTCGHILRLPAPSDSESWAVIREIQR